MLLAYSACNKLGDKLYLIPRATAQITYCHYENHRAIHTRSSPPSSTVNLCSKKLLYRCTEKEVAKTFTDCKEFWKELRYGAIPLLSCFSDNDWIKTGGFGVTSDARAYSVPKFTALKGVRINPIHTKLQWVLYTVSYMGPKSTKMTNPI